MFDKEATFAGLKQERQGPGLMLPNEFLTLSCSENLSGSMFRLSPPNPESQREEIHHACAHDPELGGPMPEHKRRVQDRNERLLDLVDVTPRGFVILTAAQDGVDVGQNDIAELLGWVEPLKALITRR